MMQRYLSIHEALANFPHSFIDIFDFEDNYEKAMALEQICFDGPRLQSHFNDANLISINQSFLRRVLKEEWDILCLATISHFSQFLLPETLRALRQSGKMIVGFFGDDETQYSKHRFWLGLFDAVIAYTEREVEAYQQVNRFTYLLPIGVGKPQISNPPHDKDIDVVFIGRPYASRATKLESLLHAGINVHIFGSRRWIEHPVLRRNYKGYLDSDHFWEVLNRSKIVLNLMEDAGGDPHINAKVFEAAMAGSMPLTTYYPPFETTYGLVEGKNIVFYENQEELIRKIQYYLKSDDHRKHVTEQLHAHLYRHFSYESLYERLFNRLVNQWHIGLNGRVNRPTVDVSDFSVIQIVRNKEDFNRAKTSWSPFEDLHILYVSLSKRFHPDVSTIRELINHIKSRKIATLNRFILLAAPDNSFDPAVFHLVPLYATADYFEDGVFCNSLVERKRFIKSIHLYDIGNSIWRRESFIQYSAKILRWYKFLGRSVPARAVRHDLTLLPIMLFQAHGKPNANYKRRYKTLVEIARRIRSIFHIIGLRRKVDPFLGD
jgi:glycosyltransferase involved in cell wall biosynthesis